MTPADTAALMNMLNFSFWLGVLVGVLGFIVLGRLSNWAIARIHLPQRIKTRDGYMYRWKRIYISQSERDQRIQQVRDDYLIKRKAGF